MAEENLPEPLISRIESWRVRLLRPLQGGGAHWFRKIAFWLLQFLEEWTTWENIQNASFKLKWWLASVQIFLEPLLFWPQASRLKRSWRGRASRMVDEIINHLPYLPYFCGRLNSLIWTIAKGACICRNDCLWREDYTEKQEQSQGVWWITATSYPSSTRWLT